MELAALLGCLEATYTTLEMRETSKEKAAGTLLSVTKLALYCETSLY